MIADGLGGRPTDVKWRTCLEVAKTPNLDKLAQQGSTGLLDPVAPGVRPGSDVAHLSILGYDPYQYYPGRGVFEAAGVGLHVQQGDICFRTNFASVHQDFVVKDRRAGRISSGQEELETALSALNSKSHPEVEILFKSSTEHRGALILRGPNLSPNVTEADPHKVGQKIHDVKPHFETLEEKRTAEILNEVIQHSYELLADHPVNLERVKNSLEPANIILPRGASAMPHLESIEHKYGIKSAVIAGGALYAGIAQLIGMERIHVEGATGGLDSNLNNKVEAALEALSTYDFVFVHMKGADTAGHDKDAEAKIKFIEKIDKAMGILRKNVNWDVTHLAFTGDHCTPIQYGDHTGEPVPLMFVGPHVDKDQVGYFDEMRTPYGAIGRVSGNVLPMLASYNNWLKKFGA